MKYEQNILYFITYITSSDSDITKLNISTVCFWHVVLQEKKHQTEKQTAGEKINSFLMQHHSTLTCHKNKRVKLSPIKNQSFLKKGLRSRVQYYVEQLNLLKTN